MYTEMGWLTALRGGLEVRRQVGGEIGGRCSGFDAFYVDRHCRHLLGPRTVLKVREPILRVSLAESFPALN